MSYISSFSSSTFILGLGIRQFILYHCFTIVEFGENNQVKGAPVVCSLLTKWFQKSKEHSESRTTDDKEKLIATVTGTTAKFRRKYYTYQKASRTRKSKGVENRNKRTNVRTLK